MVVGRNLAAEIEPPVCVALHIKIYLFKSVRGSKFRISLHHLLVHPALYRWLYKVPNLVVLRNGIRHSTHAVDVLIHYHKLIHCHTVVNVCQGKRAKCVIPAPYVGHTCLTHNDSLCGEVTQGGNSVAPHYVSALALILVLAFEFLFPRDIVALRNICIIVIAHTLCHNRALVKKIDFYGELIFPVFVGVNVHICKFRCNLTGHAELFKLKSALQGNKHHATVVLEVAKFDNIILNNLVVEFGVVFCNLNKNVLALTLNVSAVYAVHSDILLTAVKLSGNFARNKAKLCILAVINGQNSVENILSVAVYHI